MITRRFASISFVLLSVVIVVTAFASARTRADSSLPVMSGFMAERGLGTDEGVLARRGASGTYESESAGYARGRSGKGNSALSGQAGSSALPPFEDDARRGRPADGVLPEFSPLEVMYARRIDNDITQYGYDLFGVPGDETRRILEGVAGQEPAMPSGAVQDHFILHSGDEVEIVFSGQRTDRSVMRVNSEGLLLIEDFPPIPAAGRSIGQVRISIESAAANLYNTQAYVSLASVRQIGVLVVGHVKEPGRQSLTVFHTVLDALMEAGGVQKTGSLRQIKLVRQGRGEVIDLYRLLMDGAAGVDLSLRDGDRIIVPPVGPTVAIAGEVKRPGVYEILPGLQGGQRISLDMMLDFAAGVLTPGDNRLMRLGLMPDGTEKMEEVADPGSRIFGDGDILMVAKGLDKRTDIVELAGHTRKPGLFPLSENNSLARLLKGEQVLGPDIYPLIGVIERWDPQQLTGILYSFPVKGVIAGDFDRNLHDGDIVHLFSKVQVENLDKDPLQGFEEVVHDSAFLEEGSRMGAEGVEQVTIADPVMAAFLRERSAFVRGAVRRPGAYPVADGVTLDSLLAVAGGLALEANTANIEISSAYQGKDGQAFGRSGTQRLRINFQDTDPAGVEIFAGDAVRVNQKFKKIEDQSVLIIGEVMNPGRYDVAPGDKMSDLLNRAGGLSRYAYADGAIFSRRSERLAEEQRFRSAARDLEQSIALALQREDDGPSPEQVAQAQSLVQELKNIRAVGRITVEADPAVLAVEPELDILLEPGDRIFVPKRPLTVRVAGEVLSPAALQFRESKKPRDYVEEAGDFTFNADKDRTFVLLPDGSAKPLAVNVWNHNPSFIPPGSTIVVPRDPKPFDFIQGAKDISQILANLAITGVFIDDVRDGD